MRNLLLFATPAVMDTVLFLVQFAVSYGAGERGLNTRQCAWLGGLFQIVYMAVSLAAGFVLSRRNARRVLLASVVLAFLTASAALGTTAYRPLLALMAGFCVHPRPRAIVSFYGYGDIVGDWYSRPDPFYCQQPRVSEAESELHVPGPETAELYEGRGKGKLYLYCRQNGLWPQVVGGHDPVAEPGSLETSLLGMTFLETLSRYSVTQNSLELAD